jgi:hypothetical protein
MIEIIGPEDSAEFEAANEIANQFTKLWPGLRDSPKHEEFIKFVASAKLSGYQVSDIDVIIIGNFKKSERKFIPLRSVKDTSDNFVEKIPITVENFLIAIEVKDQSQNRVKIIGDNIMVQYTRERLEWSSATDQNVKQVHSLRSYFRDNCNEDLYIHRLVYLRNVEQTELNFIGQGFSAVDFLTCIAAISKIKFYNNKYHLHSFDSKDAPYIFDVPIFRKVTPTNLDRFKMDKILATEKQTQEIAEYMGKKCIFLRGHGGTGKTIMFMQSAWQSYEKYGKRILVLTYNIALAADIRRILSLLNIYANEDSRCINVESIYSHMYKLFHIFGIIDNEEDSDFSFYEDYCKNLNKHINEMDYLQIREFTNEHHNFDYDAVIIDEGQDWPNFEIKVLKQLYGLNKLCISDGIDQLIRGEQARWVDSIEKEQVLTITLEKSLRMKKNLGVFVKEFANIYHLPMNVLPNEKSGGGRVIILNNSYSNHEALNSELLEELYKSGNSNVDSLFCSTDSQNYLNFFDKLNIRVWNGFDEKIRKDYVRDKNSLRLFHYESIRGLEGWLVVLDQLDLYYESLINDNISHNQAIFRILIALSRPIDTLVITFHDPDSEFSKQILNITNKFPDFVERYL